ATVRSELQGIESALQGLRLELAGREALPSVPPRVHATWLRAQLARLDELLRQEPAQAKAEIAKHLDGELTVRPLPSTGRERRAEVRGRANSTASWKARRLFAVKWLRGLDLNQRPLGYEPNNGTEDDQGLPKTAGRPCALTASRSGGVDSLLQHLP